jgi:hypothetical protein
MDIPDGIKMDPVQDTCDIKSNKSKDKKHKKRYDTMSSIPDHSVKPTEQGCIVYKFQSRPPYEGFVLILIIVIIAIILLWWLNTKLKASEQ